MQKYWLLKSEPDVYSIEKMAKDKKTLWENVRNYQARNFISQDMKLGDLALFYHSNANPPAAVGVVRVSRAAQADPTQFDQKSDYYEPRATRETPVWFCVQVEFVKKFAQPVSLSVIKAERSLSKMALLNNSRLSVQPVTSIEFETIIRLSE